MRMIQVALAALIAGTAVPAGAQMVQAQDPQSLVAAMQAAGYAAKLGTDKVGDPMITSGSSGTAFQIFFYNCTAHKACATVQFHAGYDLEKGLAMDRINAWNSSQRFGRAYLDKDNDPIVEMDLDLDDGGLSRALFNDNIEFWTSIMTAFQKHIGYSS